MHLCGIVHGHHDAGVIGEGIQMRWYILAQTFEVVLIVDHNRLNAELITHFTLPALRFGLGSTQNQHAVSPAFLDQAREDQPGLRRLPQASIISDEQSREREFFDPLQWFELVRFEYQTPPIDRGKVATRM